MPIFRSIYTKGYENLEKTYFDIFVADRSNIDAFFSKNFDTFFMIHSISLHHFKRKQLHITMEVS